jgi:SAM-dependent methyltransferase
MNSHLEAEPNGFTRKPNFLIEHAGIPVEYSIKFDAMSLIGRTFFNRKPKLFNGYCNLGCGPRYIEGYCNADIFSFNLLRSLLGKTRVKTDWELDLRFRLNCKDNFFDGVLIEHTMEHLAVKHALMLMKELRRVLKPGGILRVSVPDLEKYVQFYTGELPDKKFYNWVETPAEAIWSLAYNFGHHSVYDYGLMEKLLKKAGFTSVRRCAFNSSEDNKLQIDDPGRRWESLYVEAKN